MKNYLIILIVFFISCTQKKEEEASTIKTDSVVSVNPVPAEARVLTNEDKIAEIRKAVQHINTLVLLVKDFKWTEPSCADVGTIAYYLNNDTIVKVTETGFIGDGGWTKEYYYNQGKFIFSFEQNIGGPAGLPADTNEMRIYADADTLVLQRKNKDYLEDVSKKFTASSREYRVLKALKDKNFGQVLCN